MTHRSFLLVRSAVLLAVSAIFVLAERSHADVQDEILEQLYLISSKLGFSQAVVHPSNLEGALYDFDDDVYYQTAYMTNQVDWRRTFLPGWRQDLYNWLYPFTLHTGAGESDTGLTRKDNWEFLWYGWGNNEDSTEPYPDFRTTSHVEFENIVFGQNADFSLWGEVDNSPSNLFEKAFAWQNATEAFDNYGLVLWNIWQAEAWRRLLAAVTTSTNSWDTPEGSNVWNDVLVDSTNGVPRVPTSSTNLWDNSLSFVSNSVPTNSIAWGQYGTTNASPDMPQPLVRDLGWVWTPPESGAYEVKLFGFEQLDGNLTGSLAIDFTDSSWGVVNKVAKFFWALGTALFMFALLRNEWNFWTTLGGSAT